MKIGLDICFWRHNQAGGVQTLLINEIIELDKLLLCEKGVEVFLLGTTENLKYFEGRLENIKTVSVYPIIKNKLHKLLCEQVFLPMVAYKYKLKIVHTFNYFGPIFLPCRSILSIFDMNYKAVPQTFTFSQRFARAVLIRFSVSRASGIMTISSFSKKEITKYIRTRVPIFPILLATNFKKISPVELEDKQTKGYFLSVGSAFRHKNLKTLIDAYSIYCQESLSFGNKPKKLRIVGHSKRGHDSIRDQIQSLGLVDSVDILGFVSNEELRDLYFFADGLIFPSLYEGFGIPPLEAMSLGCPVVCSDSASLPEVVGDAAILVNATDPKAIAQAIFDIEKKETRATLQRKGLAHVDKFSWEEASKGLLHMYLAIDSKK